MSNSIFHVRPLDSGKGWVIDEYDGRGAWQSTYRNNAKGEPMDKQEAQRIAALHHLRRKARDGMYPPSTRVYSGQDMVGDSSDEEDEIRILTIEKKDLHKQLIDAKDDAVRLANFCKDLLDIASECPARISELEALINRVASPEYFGAKK